MLDLCPLRKLKDVGWHEFKDSTTKDFLGVESVPQVDLVVVLLDTTLIFCSSSFLFDTTHNPRTQSKWLHFKHKVILFTKGHVDCSGYICVINSFSISCFTSPIEYCLIYYEKIYLQILLLKTNWFWIPQIWCLCNVGSVSAAEVKRCRLTWI